MEKSLIEIILQILIGLSAIYMIPNHTILGFILFVVTWTILWSLYNLNQNNK
jgi:hypothetical protein